MNIYNHMNKLILGSGLIYLYPQWRDQVDIDTSAKTAIKYGVSYDEYKSWCQELDICPREEKDIKKFASYIKRGAPVDEDIVEVLNAY